MKEQIESIKYYIGFATSESNSNSIIPWLTIALTLIGFIITIYQIRKEIGHSKYSLLEGIRSQNNILFHQLNSELLLKTHWQELLEIENLIFQYNDILDKILSKKEIKEKYIKNMETILLKIQVKLVPNNAENNDLLIELDRIIQNCIDDTLEINSITRLRQTIIYKTIDFIKKERIEIIKQLKTINNERN